MSCTSFGGQRITHKNRKDFTLQSTYIQKHVLVFRSSGFTVFSPSGMFAKATFIIFCAVMISLASAMVSPGVDSCPSIVRDLPFCVDRLYTVHSVLLCVHMFRELQSVRKRSVYSPVSLCLYSSVLVSKALEATSQSPKIMDYSL